MEGDISSLLPNVKFSGISKVFYQLKNIIFLIGVDVPRGNCPTNEGICPVG